MDTDPSLLDISSLPSGYLYKVEQLQLESCRAGWDSRGAALYPACSCIWDTNWKWQLPPPKKGRDLTSLHFHTHSQHAQAVPSPSSPSTSPNAVLGEDPEGNSAVPYRGLLLLCIGIALIICAERGVSAGTTQGSALTSFFQACGSP